MGVTASGITFPDDSSPIASLQDDLQAMAESVETAIAPSAETAASLGITIGSDWSIVNFSAIKLSLLRVIQGRFTYSGSTLTGNSKGALSSQSTVLSNLPVDWTPPTATPIDYLVPASGSGGQGSIEAGGTAILRTLHATATIASGNDIFFKAIWMVSA